MQQQQVEKLKKWFDRYVSGFYGNDEFVNANLKLKEDHSRRCCDEMLYLTDRLDLQGNQSRIAEIIALLHDIGRFEQFGKHGTYVDLRSVNHCRLGLDVIEKTRILDDVDAAERKFITQAVELHGTKELPSDLDGDGRLYCELIRDTDKLDIYYIATEGYKAYERDPANFKLEIELPHDSGYSPQMIEDILTGRRIAYEKLQTWDDMKLLQLGWVYDINYTATLERIKKRGFLEQIISYLPADKNIEKVAGKILGYVDQRLKI